MIELRKITQLPASSGNEVKAQSDLCEPSLSTALKYDLHEECNKKITELKRALGFRDTKIRELKKLFMSSEETAKKMMECASRRQANLIRKVESQKATMQEMTRRLETTQASL